MLLALGPGLDTPPAAEAAREPDAVDVSGAPTDPWERLAWVAAGDGE